MEQKPIMANYLITKDDLRLFAAVAVKDQYDKVTHWFCRIAGLALIIFGLVGAIFLTDFFLQRMIYLLMVFAGFAIGLYYDTLHIYLTKKQVKAYVNRRKCRSETMYFYKTCIQFQLEDYQAIIPYSMLYKVTETKDVYIIKIGIDHIRFVPKRALSPENCNKITHCFETELKENFKREGVR